MAFGNMKIIIFLTSCCLFVSAYNGWGKSIYAVRNKRDAGGTLDIVNNHADPIHADVKSDGTEAPCNLKNDVPSIEDGVGFKVTPPKDGEIIKAFEAKSFRKSLPVGQKLTESQNILQKNSKLEIVKSVNRLMALFILSLCLIIELYPVLEQIFHVVTGL